MTNTLRLLSLCTAVSALFGCAHEQLTASEHRQEAAKNQIAAQQELAQYDPTRTQQTPPPVVLGEVPPEQLTWNPTEQHLELAERHQRAAKEHQQAALELERFEDQACVNVPKAARAACPLFGPSVSTITNLKNGVKVTLKNDAAVDPIVSRLKCHLAFAHNRGFDHPECPLYVKGVVLEQEAHGFSLTSADPKVADAIRADARQIFGLPVASR